LNDKEVKRKKKKEMMALTAANYMNNKLLIENKYASMMSLIDTIYPPLLCTQCDAAFTSKADSNHHYIEKHKRNKRYLCIHPHCDQRFISRAALRFHISRSHLVVTVKKPLHDPPLIQYNAPKPKQINLSTAAATVPVKQYQKDLVTMPTTTTKLNIKNLNTHKASTTIISNNKKKITHSIHNSLIIDDLTLSPPPSPFSLYQYKRNSTKKPTLSSKAEQFLNSVYPPLQCPSCNQIFNRKTNVIKHLTESHLGQEPYRCIYPSCNHPRLYATREGLVYHIVRVHDDEK
jgi:uncharacterized C2H2 Zn-finger protein